GGAGGEEALWGRGAAGGYVGRGYELRIPLPGGPIDDVWIAGMRETFHEHHLRRYYRRYDDAPIQIVNIRVVGVGLRPDLSLAKLPRAESASPRDAVVGTGEGTFVVHGEPQSFETLYYDRALLKAAHVVAGPAVIQQFDSTTVVNPGLAAVVDEFGNLAVDCSSARDTGLTSVAETRKDT